MIIKLAIKNILHKPLHFLLGWILLTVSVGIISLLLMVQKQVEEQFSNNIKGVDMVIGAKGSPLQLILSAVYHIDAPTGNIKMEEAQKWMQHPFVEKAIPLAYGDSYKGYPIIGTTPDYLSKYNATVGQGKLFANNFEVVVGHELAQLLQLKIGDRFFGTHGDKEGGEAHEETAYQVTGILQPTGLVIDKLIIGNIESVWKMHEAHEEPATAKTTEKTKTGNEKGEHGQHDKNEQHEEHEDHEEITAVLITFRNPMAQMQLPRAINANTGMMAALPAIEINRLFSLLGVGIDTLEKIAWGIMLLSALSVFITLFNALKERRYELALMRTMGGGRLKMMLLVLIESLSLCLAGFVCGMFLSRLALYFLSKSAEADYHFSLHNFGWQRQEGYLLLLTVLVGIVAALIPAVKAYRLNISKTLANG
jgi:putative ABC transport system permease protein